MASRYSSGPLCRRRALVRRAVFRVCRQEMGEAVKFQAERDALVEALALAGRATPQRASGAVFTNATHMEVVGSSLTLVGTDLSLTLRVALDVVGERDGACVAPARLATEIIRAMEPGAITVAGTDTEIEITGGRSRFVMPTFSPADFPRVPGDQAPRVAVPADALTEAIHQVARAASTDDARPLLCGVLLSKEGAGWRLAATDSYRLAWRDVGGLNMPLDTESVIVPARALSELERLCTASAKGAGNTVGVSVAPLQATFVVGGVQLTTRLLDGSFPDYRRLVPPEYATVVRAEKAPLIDALRRMKLLVKDHTTPVRLVVAPAGIDLSVVSQAVGSASEAVEAAVEGPEIEIAFNPTYLIDGLDAVAGAEATISFTDATHPALISSPTSDAYGGLLMPVRLS